MASSPFSAADCSLFWRGHQIHWVQWRRSLTDGDGLRGRVVHLDGELFRVALGDGSIRSYRHHDPQRLAQLVLRAGPNVWVQERWSLMRVGSGHCLSISGDSERRLDPCLPGRLADTALIPARVSPWVGSR